MRATLRLCLRAGSCVILVLALAGPLPAAEIHYAANPVHGSWLVEIEPGAPMASLAHALAAAHGGQVGSMHEGRFRGFVLRVPDQAIPGLAHHPLIKNLIQDELYEDVLSEAAPYCYGPEQMPNTRPLPNFTAGTVQTLDCTEPEEGSGGPTCIDNWGLDRVGEERPPSDFRYQWPANGATRRIYHFDTGVRGTHREFEGAVGQSRVVHLFNATNDADGDGHGHGTHVAAIAAGRTYGVAKWATIYRVQVVAANATTQLTWIMDGFQAIDDHLTMNPTVGIAVMNWSGGNDPLWVLGQDKQYVLLRQKLVDLLEAHPNLSSSRRRGIGQGIRGIMPAITPSVTIATSPPSSIRSWSPPAATRPISVSSAVSGRRTSGSASTSSRRRRSWSRHGSPTTAPPAR